MLLGELHLVREDEHVVRADITSAREASVGVGARRRVATNE